MALVTASCRALLLPSSSTAFLETLWISEKFFCLLPSGSSQVLLTLLRTYQISKLAHEFFCKQRGMASQTETTDFML